MRRKNLRLFVVMASLASATLLTACPRQGEGPAERVGKTMDKGVSAVGHGVEKTGEVIQDTAEGR